MYDLHDGAEKMYPFCEMFCSQLKETFESETVQKTETWSIHIISWRCKLWMHCKMEGAKHEVSGVNYWLGVINPCVIFDIPTWRALQIGKNGWAGGISADRLESHLNQFKEEKSPPIITAFVVSLMLITLLPALDLLFKCSSLMWDMMGGDSKGNEN